MAQRRDRAVDDIVGCARFGLARCISGTQTALLIADNLEYKAPIGQRSVQSAPGTTLPDSSLAILAWATERSRIFSSPWAKPRE